MARNSLCIGALAFAVLGMTACERGRTADVGSAPSRTGADSPGEGSGATSPGVTSSTDVPVPAFPPVTSGSAVASTPSSGAARPASAPTTVHKASTSTPLLPFAADMRPDVSSTRIGFSVLVGVTKGVHPGYVRYVFQFTNQDIEGHPLPGEARPSWDVRYIPSAEALLPVLEEPVSLASTFALRISFTCATMYPDERSSLVRSVPEGDPLISGTDFEGRVEWFLAIEQQRPFRTSYAGSSKVVVDVFSLR